MTEIKRGGPSDAVCIFLFLFSLSILSSRARITTERGVLLRARPPGILYLARSGREAERGNNGENRDRERASVFIRYGVKHERTEIKE